MILVESNFKYNYNYNTLKDLFCSCRYTALDTTLELLPFIGEAIQQMLDSAEHRADEATAENLKNAIMKFGFIYSLVVCCQVLSVTKMLCVSLQGWSLLLSRFLYVPLNKEIPGILNPCRKK